MPTVPKLFDPTGTADPVGMGDMSPGPSQVLQAAAIMHGHGRLLADGTGAHSAALGSKGPGTPKGRRPAGGERGIRAKGK